MLRTYIGSKTCLPKLLLAEHSQLNVNRVFIPNTRVLETVCEYGNISGMGDKGDKGFEGDRGMNGTKGDIGETGDMGDKGTNLHWKTFLVKF